MFVATALPRAKLKAESNIFPWLRSSFIHRDKTTYRLIKKKKKQDTYIWMEHEAESFRLTQFHMIIKDNPSQPHTRSTKLTSEHARKLRLSKNKNKTR